MSTIACVLLVLAAAGTETPQADAPTASSWREQLQPYFKVRFGYYFDSEDRSNAFYLEKLYLGATIKVSEEVTFCGRAQFSQDGVYAKRACLRWQPLEGGGHVTLGIHADAYIEYAEEAWGLRFVRRILPDDVSAWPETDLGVSYTYTAGECSYSLRVVNGEGYKHTEDDKYKGCELAVHLRPSPLAPEWLLPFGIDMMAYVTRQATADGSDPDETYCALLSWKNERLRLGCEYVLRRTTGIGRGWSVYGVAAVGERLEVFARFDTYEPDESVPANEHRLIMGGIATTRKEGLRFALSWQHDDNDAAGLTRRLVFSVEMTW